MKKIAIKVDRKMSEGLQRFAFIQGFKWAGSEMGIVRQPSYNYFLIFDLDKGEIDWMPEFREDDIDCEIIRMKTMKVDDDVRFHPVMEMLLQVLREYSRPLPEPKEKPEIVPVVPKFPTIIKKRYQREKIEPVNALESLKKYISEKAK